MKRQKESNVTQVGSQKDHHICETTESVNVGELAVQVPLAAFTLNLSLRRASSVSKSHFTSSYKACRDKSLSLKVDSEIIKNIIHISSCLWFWLLAIVHAAAVTCSLSLI